MPPQRPKNHRSPTRTLTGDLVCGRIPVIECLRAGRRNPKRLHMLEGAAGLEDIPALCPGVPVRFYSRQELDAFLPGGTHQGVILEADPLPLLDLDVWIKRGIPEKAVVVLLDEIEDPHNFGAIVRSAAACGAEAVVFCRHRSAPISAAASKAAAGAMDHVRLIEATNMVRVIQGLQKEGFWILELDADADKTIWQVDLSGRIGIVVGSEGQGVRRLVSENCDFHAKIPLSGPITSLNASVSAAVALVECLRQRGV